MAPPQQLNGIWHVVVVDSAPVRQAAPIVIVVGDGLFAQPAAAWYRGRLASLGHQVELDAGAQLPLVGVVAAVAVRREACAAAAGCCAVHGEEVAVRLVQQLAAALEAEGPALAVGVAAAAHVYAVYAAHDTRVFVCSRVCMRHATHLGVESYKLRRQRTTAQALQAACSSAADEHETAASYQHNTRISTTRF
jgi:hypothetical protein